MTGLLVGLAVFTIGGRGRWLAVPAAVTVLNPVLGILVLGGMLFVVRWRALAAARWVAARTAEDAITLAELTALGLTAGLTFPAALAAAHPHVGAELQEEVDALLRHSRRHGLAHALSAGQGHARPLYVAAARAVSTGAPLAASVALHVREARADAQSARLARARRLPVRLMLPLALLILPGFILVAIGPAVLSAFDRIALPR